MSVYLRAENSDGDDYLFTGPEDVEPRQLSGSLLTGEAVDAAPSVPGLAAAILNEIESGQGELNMFHWHGPPSQPCQTVHCLAGWAIHKAGIPGYALEAELGSEIAGALIWAASTGERVPDFRASEREALEDLQARAACEKAGIGNG